MVDIKLPCIASLFFPGEPFSPEEMEEMLSVAVNPDTSGIIYKDYIPVMTIE